MWELVECFGYKRRFPDLPMHGIAHNITPDPETGIGNWSESLFVQTMRNGKYMGTSRNLLPPMPWQGIGKLSDDDLKSVFAYLMSVPPVDNEVPTPIPPSQ